jgi:hypothetical protein
MLPVCRAVVARALLDRLPLEQALPEKEALLEGDMD